MTRDSRMLFSASSLFFMVKSFKCAGWYFFVR